MVSKIEATSMSQYGRINSFDDITLWMQIDETDFIFKYVHDSKIDANGRKQHSSSRLYPP